MADVPAMAAKPATAGASFGALLAEQRQVTQQQTEAFKTAVQPAEKALQESLSEETALRASSIGAMENYLHQASLAMQRQQLLGVQHAADLKKYLPIMAAFMVVGGALGGGGGALAALAGSLVGFSRGRQNQYKQAYDEWKQSSQQILDSAKLQIQSVKDILDESHKTVQEKIENLKLAVTSNGYLLKALEQNDLTTFMSRFTSLENATAKMQKVHDHTDAKLKPPTGQQVKEAMDFGINEGWIRDDSALIARIHSLQGSPAISAPGSTTQGRAASAAANTELGALQERMHADQVRAEQLASMALKVQAETPGMDWNTAMGKAYGFLNSHNLVESVPATPATAGELRMYKTKQGNFTAAQIQGAADKNKITFAQALASLNK